MGHHGVDRRGDDDPATVALAAHLRGCGLAAEEAAVKVHLDDPLEGVGRHLGELLPVRDPGVRAEDVQAPELPHRLGHQVLALERV